MTKIGIIGPKTSCSLVVQHIEQIDPTIECKSYCRERVADCSEVVEACEQECEAIIFTGCGIEGYVKTHCEISVPFTYIKRSVSNVAAVFFQMMKKKMPVDAFSIDAMDPLLVEDLLDEFQIKGNHVYVSSFRPEMKEEEYVEWHMALQEEKKTDVALTSFVHVYQMLKERGYNIFYLAPSKGMVRVALENLKQEHALNKAEHAQVAVELLQLTNYQAKQENYYSNMLKKAETETDIIKYVKQVQGSVFNFGRREFIIFANAGGIKQEENYDKLMLLQESVKEYGFILNIGIGFGTTIYKAEMSARKALEHSLQINKQGIYQIDEANVLTGPLGTAQELQYSLAAADPKIQMWAKESGLGTESVQKIIGVAKLRQSYVFDAHELAECLEITIRSARRIMNKLMNSGFGKVHAIESPTGGGRPKALIEILFK